MNSQDPNLGGKSYLCRVIVNKITIKAATFLVIGIMALIVANKAVFLHTHQLANGTLIAHAHPFDRSNDTNPHKSHHHTQTELVFLDSFKILYPIFLVLLAVCLSPISSRSPAVIPTQYSSACIFIYQGRAPPLH